MVSCGRFVSSTQIIIPNFIYLSLLALSPGTAKLVCHFCEKRLSWGLSFLHLVQLESESSEVTNKYISDYHHRYYSQSYSNFFKAPQELRFHTVWIRIMAEEVAKRGSRFIQIRLFKRDCYSINSSPPCGVEGSVIGNHQMAGYRWCYTFYLQLALEEVLIVSCGAVLPPHENTAAKTCPARTSVISKALLDVSVWKDFSKVLPWEGIENPMGANDCEWAAPWIFICFLQTISNWGNKMLFGSRLWEVSKALQKQKERNLVAVARWQSISRFALPLWSPRCTSICTISTVLCRRLCIPAEQLGKRQEN